MFSSQELFLSHPKFQQGLELVLAALAELQTDATVFDEEAYSRQLQRVGGLRGRPLFFPYVGSGVGKGAKVRTADGRWLLDFAIGIGVHFFGHTHPDLVRTAITAAASDIVIQGNLQANAEYGDLLEVLLQHSAPQFAHGWLSVPGTEANENALKLIRHHAHPARDIIAFRRCFHGRTTTMAEITDRPDYRKGQPIRERVFYLPFYEPDDPDSSRKTLSALREILDQHPGEIAACVFELVQGEAGFRVAPREFFVPLMEILKERGVCVWVDEVQTFGRTGELFAFQKLALTDYIDVVTVGKLLQNSALLFRAEYQPDPALISGTFAGTTVGLAVGRCIVEKLVQENFLGPHGRIAELGQYAQEGLARLQQELPSCLRSFSGVGAMWSVEPVRASLADIKALLHECYRNGLIAYYSGFEDGPYRLRLFLPGGVLTVDELDEAFAILRFSLLQLRS